MSVVLGHTCKLAAVVTAALVGFGCASVPPAGASGHGHGQGQREAPGEGTRPLPSEPASAAASAEGAGAAAAVGKTVRPNAGPALEQPLPYGPPWQDPVSSADGRKTKVDLGVGFTADPDAFLLGGSVGFLVGEQLFVGPHLQLGLDDNETLVAATVAVEKEFNLETESDARRLHPFVRGGIGILFLDEENRPGDDDDAGLLLNVGGGARYALDDRFAIGSTLLFNFLPADVHDENFFISWELAQVEFKF